MIRGDTYPIDLRELRQRLRRPTTFSALEDLLAPLGLMLVQTRSGKWQIVIGLFRRDVRIPRMHSASRAAAYFAVERIGRGECEWLIDLLEKLEAVALHGRGELERGSGVRHLPDFYGATPWCLHIVVMRWRALERHTCPAGLESGEGWRELEPWAEELGRRVADLRAPTC